jgi:hypothetical protein
MISSYMHGKAGKEEAMADNVKKVVLAYSGGLSA